MSRQTQHRIGNSENLMLLHTFSFNLNHYTFTGFILIDTHVREELGGDACRNSFQFIHGQFWSLKSSCHLVTCYFCFTFIIHNSTREKHAQWRKPSQAGQPAKS